MIRYFEIEARFSPDVVKTLLQMIRYFEIEAQFSPDVVKTLLQMIGYFEIEAQFSPDVPRHEAPGKPYRIGKLALVSFSKRNA
ncbi:hypothetical protein RRG08_057019 [Elysia crispata]|uniref:Uncharacterized protein n=1 Tax=Elysia crispata TaxID=231223 RepID=A0AAE0Z7A4_9GAST|nr:hypothetical protein RRG08_057019 [Elysia crispata]